VDCVCLAEAGSSENSNDTSGSRKVRGMSLLTGELSAFQGLFSMELATCNGSSVVIKSQRKHKPLLLCSRLPKITLAEIGLCFTFSLLGHDTQFRDYTLNDSSRVYYPSFRILIAAIFVRTEFLEYWRMLSLVQIWSFHRGEGSDYRGSRFIRNCDNHTSDYTVP
jgi:hypothetical protein